MVDIFKLYFTINMQYAEKTKASGPIVSLELPNGQKKMIVLKSEFAICRAYFAGAINHNS